MNTSIPSQPLLSGGVLHAPTPAFSVALRLADEISKLDLGSITKERVAMVNIIRNEIEQDRRNSHAALVAALEDIHRAGELHMEAHPTDGAKWHQANADFYTALAQARSALQQAKQGGGS